MNLVKVDNGEIKQYSLPKTGTLKDGSTVSGYDNLMKSDPILAKQEGWLPLEDNPPEYNTETQYLVFDGYEILEDKVIKKYLVEDIPEQIELEPEPSLDDYLLDMDLRLSMLELGL